MNIFTKAGFGLVALAALTQAGAAHAVGVIDVAPTVTAPAAGSNAPYQYSYAVTPVPDQSNAVSSLNFQFVDPSVTYVSSTGPLDVVTPAGIGSFGATSSTGKTLNSGSTENFLFTSFNAPQGTLNVTGQDFITINGIGNFSSTDYSGPVAGPAAVPEASTTVSFGLLLALGLSGAVIAARKKKQTA